MTIGICPRCQRRFLYNPKIDVDFEHQCDSQDEVLDNEDVPKLGTYVDDNGNTVEVVDPFRQGIANELEGTRAGIEGADVEPLTSRGKRKSTHVTRQHYEFIVLKDRGGC